MMASNRLLHTLSAVVLVLLSAADAAGKDKDAADRSLVVLDKQCKRIVEPYTFAGTVTTTITDTGIALWEKMPKLGAPKNEKEIGDSVRLRAKRSNWLPMSTEVLYGQRAHGLETGILGRETKVGKKLYPIADAMLADLGKPVSADHEYRFQLFILKNAGRNAMARPGGFLYVDQGLLADNKEHPKARFALAHELAHVLQRHETRELQGLIVDSYQDEKELKQAMAASKTDPAAVLGNVKVSKDTYTQHHIDQELQADSCAARLLFLAYPDGRLASDATDAFIRDLPPPSAGKSSSPTRPRSKSEKLAQAAHDIVKLPADRHPNTRERTANLKSMQGELLASGH